MMAMLGKLFFLLHVLVVVASAKAPKEQELQASISIIESIAKENPAEWNTDNGSFEEPPRIMLGGRRLKRRRKKKAIAANINLLTAEEKKSSDEETKAPGSSENSPSFKVANLRTEKKKKKKGKKKKKKRGPKGKKSLDDQSPKMKKDKKKGKKQKKKSDLSGTNSDDVGFGKAQPSPSPTSAPVQQPTPAPVVQPTPAPVVTPPTPAPVVQQTPPPTPQPTPVPVVQPTPAPVAQPTPAPVFQPTPAPISPSGFPIPNICQEDPFTANGLEQPCLICPAGQYSDDQTVVDVGGNILTCVEWSLSGICGVIPAGACTLVQTETAICSNCITLPNVNPL